MLCGSLHGREVQGGNGYLHVCGWLSESLRCPPETITTLLISCTPKKIKVKKKKKQTGHSHVKHLRTSQKIPRLYWAHLGLGRIPWLEFRPSQGQGHKQVPLCPGFCFCHTFRQETQGAGRAQHLCQVLIGHFITLSSCSRFPLNPQMDWVKLQTYSRLHQFFMVFFFSIGIC